MHHRLHALSTGHRGDAECSPSPNHTTRSCVRCAYRVVVGCWRQHPWGLGGGEESGWHCSISPVRVLRWIRVLVFYQLKGR